MTVRGVAPGIVIPKATEFRDDHSGRPGGNGAFEESADDPVRGTLWKR